MPVRQRRGQQTADRLLDAALAVHESSGRDGFTVQATGFDDAVHRRHQFGQRPEA